MADARNSMIRLPIDPFVPRVIQALGEGKDVVLVAEPGAGKTTRIAPAVVQSRLLGRENEQVVMLQPRRVAARAAAGRIAEEQRWTLGEEVGYQVRFERVMARHTPLRVVTEGILVRRLVADPELAGTGCVILDEFHERSIHSDLSLAMLREAKAALRPELRLIVMSATLDADAVAAFLRQVSEVEVLHVPGRLFPVEVAYAGDVHAPIEDRVAGALERIFPEMAASSGEPAVGRDVLVFLPGVREIEWTMGALRRLAGRHGYDVMPLHGSLTKEEQDRAVHFDPATPPRVICATNIAETSLTLPGVRLVIDSGLVRQAGFDASRGVETLETVRISKASAEQRRGRAGRVAEGRCIRLWSKMTHHRLPDFDIPEIRRVDLGEAVLAVRALGGEPGSFGWYERPDEARLASADQLLERLGAVAGGRLTPLGKALQGLPIHPRWARLLSAAPPGLRQDAASVAALLGEGADVAGRRTASVAELLEAWHQRRIDPIVARAVDRARQALLRAVERLDVPPAPVNTLEELLLLAYPDRLCRRRAGDPALARLVGGGGVRLLDPSAVRGELFLALDVRRGAAAQAQQADVRLVAEVEPEWIARHFPDRLRTVESAELDAGGRVRALRRRLYEDLVLSETAGGAASPEAVRQALLEALRGQAEELVAQHEPASALLKRLAMLDRHLPPHLRPGPLAELDPHSLLEEACAGAAGIEQVKGNLRHVIESRLGHAWRQALAEHAPDQLEVPTGSRIRLDWLPADPGPPRGPVLAVRLQELFGLARTPRVCGGTVPVVLHLLGPNYRPVQVTEDLASFWRNTYPQVRKDLRARYPKHSWPEDPLAAPPVRGARRRRQAGPNGK